MERPAPYVANRTLSALSRLGNWCVERGIIEQSFAAGVKKPAKEQSRDRVLSDTEIVLFWRAADEISYPFGPLVKLLLLAAQRRDEVGAMSWSEIDIDARLWTLQGDRTKNGQRHEVPLSAQAMAVLSALPRIESPNGYVFTTTGITPASGFSKVKRKIDEQMLLKGEGANIASWRYHDLRRTAASGMARLRQPPHVVEAVINHKTGAISGVAAIYNRHDYLDEKKAALSVWSAHIESLIQLQPDNILRMTGRAVTRPMSTPMLFSSGFQDLPSR